MVTIDQGILFDFTWSLYRGVHWIGLTDDPTWPNPTQLDWVGFHL